MIELAPCLECNRHVRSGARCPFCGSDAIGAVVRPRYRGLTRAAIFVAGAAIAGCGGTTEPPPEPPDETIAQPYGAPPQPPPDEETIMQPYGAPPDNRVPDEAPPPQPDGPQVPQE